MAREVIPEENYYTNWNKGKEDLSDKYAGQACVLVANGPSLNDVPLWFLRKFPTIGTNNIYLKEDFIPTFYTILGFSQLNTEEKRGYCRDIIERARYAFVNRGLYPYFDAPHVYAIHSIDLVTRGRQVPKTKFSKNPLRTLGIGVTNTYIMLQIVYWLGFTTVMCVGLDNNYGADETKLHFYENDPRYACEPFMGRPQHKEGSYKMFELANTEFIKDGRKIININGVNNTPFQSIPPKVVW